MKKVMLLMLSLLIVGSMLLAACQPAATEAPAVEEPAAAEEEAAPVEEEAAPAEEAMSGELIFALSSDEIRLDSTITTWNTDILIHNNIYRQLYRVNEDASGLEPFAAESYTVNDDATVWTFTLRDDIKFSDGTPITAEDVVYSIERGFREESVQTWVYEEAGLESGKTTALDERTVQFELSGTFVPFLSYVSGFWASIFPKAALE
ncbi:MAG: hypothetical protein E4H15_08560, partial [Syntrophobacterales bacterium]